MSLKLFGRNFDFLVNENQQYKAITMINDYVLKPEVVILLVVLVMYCILRCSAKFLKRERLSKTLKKTSPWIYLLAILGLTVLNREAGIAEIRLIPDMWFATGGFHESTVLGFLFNVVLYIPFGYLVYKWGAFGKKAWITAVIVFVTSLSIEALQYVLARGVTAVDDLLANVVGGLIGMGFAVLMQKMRDNKRNVKAWDENG